MNSSGENLHIVPLKMFVFDVKYNDQMMGTVINATVFCMDCTHILCFTQSL